MVTMNIYRLFQGRMRNLWQPMVCADGVERTVINWTANFDKALRSFTDSTTAAGICLLGKDVTPSLEDYTVNGILNGCVEGYPPEVVTWGINNKCIEATVTVGLLGLKDGTVISAVALFGNGSDQSTTQANPNPPFYNILFDVTQLDSPIVINRGESKQLTYTIRFNSGK